MFVEHILYADQYTRKIADSIARNFKGKKDFFRITNPTFNRWSRSTRHFGSRQKGKGDLLPHNSLLIGGNRWRHHFALTLTDLPLVSIDAHADMSYDEMIPLRLVRPYNWLYFKLLMGREAHLVLPYDRWGRWTIAVPEGYLDRFHVYVFKRKRLKGAVCFSSLKGGVIEIRDVEKSPPIPCGPKQISLDLDITREIPEKRVLELLARIAREGDVCDVWLDEGKRGSRQSLNDHVITCSKILAVLNQSARRKIK